jgi:murein DD-endopeptidase MepM/ murein hydrolase activator NlpD
MGVAVGWWLRGGPIEPVQAPTVSAAVPDPRAPDPPSVAVNPPLTAKSAPETADNAIADLRRRHLRLPLDEAKVDDLKGDFAEKRTGHQHEAADMLAPRNTPIHAVDDGTIAKLFLSKAGGQTIYQFDPTGRFCYYYAHLERYATGIGEGQQVKRGDVIGYVGTSGNAPPGTPHLHFSVFVLGPEKHWWQGTAVDPYLVFAK